MMNDSEKSRLDCFEKMLLSIREQFDEKSGKLTELKSAGKEKTATYRQLFAEKMQLGNMLALYRLYGLIE
ncbi:MAG: hypothetical protein MSR67_04535 [Oscillospiraceae bacterium]|nr:hypothetical protein [Oscillospiraceae bacterium]